MLPLWRKKSKTTLKIGLVFYFQFLLGETSLCNIVIINVTSTSGIFDCYKFRTFFSLNYDLSMAGNKWSHADSRYKIGKSTLIILFRKKVCQFWWGKTPSHPLLPSQAAPFPPLDRKCTGRIRRNWLSKCLFPSRQCNSRKPLHQRLSINGKK